MVYLGGAVRVLTGSERAGCVDTRVFGLRTVESHGLLAATSVHEGHFDFPGGVTGVAGVPPVEDSTQTKEKSFVVRERVKEGTQKRQKETQQPDRTDKKHRRNEW